MSIPSHSRASCLLGLAGVALSVALAHSAPTGGAPPPSYLDCRPLPDYDLTPAGFTVECWIRTRSVPGFDPRVIRVQGTEMGPCGYPGSSVWELAICHLSDCTPGSLSFGVQASGECHAVFAHGRVDDGVYHHIAGTYDGRRLRLYIDGSLRGEELAPGLQARVRGGRLVVGNAPDYMSPFDGEIDELRVWSIARSESELRSTMDREFRELPRTLVGYWPMNGNSEDRSRGKNPLVPHNVVTFPKGRLGEAAAVANVDVLRGDLLTPGHEDPR